MWEPFMEPKLHLVNAKRRELPGFGQELAHFAIHTRPTESVLWADGSHCFNPYDFAEMNLQRGFEADDGAKRMLIKRCMTAFNWELCLDKHVPQKLETTDVSAVIMAPYDALFRHQELTDWEQEDYVRYSLTHLKEVSKRHQVPLLAMVDMDRLWHSHPVLAQLMFEQTESHWLVDSPDERWRAVEQKTGESIDPYLRRQVTLLDYHEEPEPLVPVLSPRPRKRQQTVAH